jgi:photosystem II stability/assembly factor-like uncharacterized protein
MPTRTILILALATAGATGCTFESGKCPDGYVCTPVNGTPSAGSAGQSGGSANAGGAPGGNAGSNPGNAGNSNGNAGSGNGKAGGSGDSGGSGGNVIPGNPDGTWTNATGNLEGTESDCGTIPFVTTKPGENLLIIGVVAQGVFSSSNAGKTWTKLGQGSGSADFTSGLSDVEFDPEDSSIWWLSGVRYGTPYRSDDDGDTFQKLGDFPQNDGISVDFEDPERKTILVGGHEQVREVQYSDDGGSTWTNIGANLPMGSGDSSYPYVVNDTTFMVGTSANQVYRTTDKGAHWTKVVDGGGGAKPLKHSDGSLYWAARETSGLVRSTDDGATWKVVTPGGVVYGMKPIELPDGRIAMRSPTGMLVTEDKGANWKQVTPPVPDDYWWYTTTYNVADKAFYTSRFACDGAKVVNADGLRRYPWDYTKD